MSGPVTRSQTRLGHQDISDELQHFASSVSHLCASRKWKIVDDQGKEVPFHVFESAILGQEKASLDSKSEAFLGQIASKMATLTMRQAVKLFTNQELKDPDPVYDQPLLRIDISEADTRKAAARYFGFGCDPTKRKEWMDCFAEKSVYTINNIEYATGKNGIQEHLKKKFSQLDMMTGDQEALPFEMITLNVHHNMAIAVLINKFANGGFPLVSLDFFNEKGKVIFNGDFYSFYSAAWLTTKAALGRLRCC